MRVSAARRNATLSALGASLASGYVRVYDGTRPSGPSDAITTQVLLAELRFAATAFQTPSNGEMVAYAIVQDGDANATGTATWARCLRSDGTTAEFDASVGTTGAEINLESTSIIEHMIVRIASMTITAPDGE